MAQYHLYLIKECKTDINDFRWLIKKTIKIFKYNDTTEDQDGKKDMIDADDKIK